jgi:hypothetical protein
LAEFRLVQTGAIPPLGGRDPHEAIAVTTNQIAQNPCMKIAFSSSFSDEKQS